MLSSAAFNALLKTLEEPPAHVKFIFATTEPQKVLPTILSRCQRFDLHRIAANLIAEHLQLIAGKENIKLEPAAANAIARGAEGGLRDAESMLDQLVAFCGEDITEPDVLKVFGFTSQQTVAKLTDRILRGATADAVQLLHEQCEAGKDMMRLMADLIGYLRDLLVFKVKPDALSEDIDTDSQELLAAQSELIETDRLLELIDQFAGAEGRMKWAPNKKLHFEVALIKAIQSLNQITLNEVIENLNALRDGKAVAPKKPVVAASDDTLSPERLRGGHKKPVAARAADKTAAVGRSEVADHGAVKIWREVCAKIPARGFLRTLVDSLTALGTEGRNFLLGYPPDEKSAIETLATTSNRRQLEALLKEVTGNDWSVKTSAREGLVKKKPDQSIKTASSEFKNDPLIQEALEMFKGEIK